MLNMESVHGEKLRQDDPPRATQSSMATSSCSPVDAIGEQSTKLSETKSACWLIVDHKDVLGY